MAEGAKKDGVTRVDVARHKSEASEFYPRTETSFLRIMNKFLGLIVTTNFRFMYTYARANT
jgi:hypothetical protein